jgi:hypothetical protein
MRYLPLKQPLKCPKKCPRFLEPAVRLCASRSTESVSTFLNQCFEATYSLLTDSRFYVRQRVVGFLLGVKGRAMSPALAIAVADLPASTNRLLNMPAHFNSLAWRFYVPRQTSPTASPPAGSIAITEHTRRLVEGYFQVKSRGPTPGKDLSEPVNVYEVIGVGARHKIASAWWGALSKFVGRQTDQGSQNEHMWSVAKPDSETGARGFIDCSSSAVPSNNGQCGASGEFGSPVAAKAVR